MKLHNLFENLQGTDEQEILNILKSEPLKVHLDIWKRIDNTQGSYDYIYGSTSGHDSIDYILRRIDHLNVAKISSINVLSFIRRNDSHDKTAFQKLKSIYAPSTKHLGFHDEDEFDDGEEIINFHFWIHRNYPSMSTEARAEITKKGHDIELPITTTIQQYLLQQLTDVENQIKNGTNKNLF